MKRTLLVVDAVGVASTFSFGRPQVVGKISRDVRVLRFDTYLINGNYVRATGVSQTLYCASPAVLRWTADYAWSNHRAITAKANNVFRHFLGCE